MSTRFDRTCDQGSVFGFTMTLYTDAAQTTPLDLTGCSGSLRVASSYDAAEALVELTVGAGLTFGGALGTVGVRFEEEDTDLPARPLPWSFTLVDADGNAEEKWHGSLDVKPKVPEAAA